LRNDDDECEFIFLKTGIWRERERERKRRRERERERG